MNCFNVLSSLRKFSRIEKVEKLDILVLPESLHIQMEIHGVDRHASVVAKTRTSITARESTVHASLNKQRRGIHVKISQTWTLLIRGVCY